jgi:hypothetical protein
VGENTMGILMDIAVIGRLRLAQPSVPDAVEFGETQMAQVEVLITEKSIPHCGHQSISGTAAGKHPLAALVIGSSDEVPGGACDSNREEIYHNLILKCFAFNSQEALGPHPEKSEVFF